MKYFFPTHCDCGNRGCEAILKATALLLDIDKDSIVALSNDVAADKQLHIDTYASLESPHSRTTFENIILKIKNRLVHDSYLKRCLIYNYRYGKFLSQVTYDDIVMSTGGDMFCYDDNEAVYTSSVVQDRGIMTILWGCSVGEKNLTPNKLIVLKHFDMIYVRESLSRDALLAAGLKNVVLYPDPAFILKPEPFALPEWLIEGNTLGINISNYVLGGFSLDTEFARELLSLIDFVLANTNMNIMLVPHVLWKDQDDTIVSKLISDHYIPSNRVYTLNTYELGYCQIRYAISKCRFFIGARTHSVISAYSTYVPTIALGYSIKAKGIAQDLGLPIETIVDSKSAIKKDMLIQSFQYLQNNEMMLKMHLDKVMPDYVQSVYGIKNELNKLKNE